MKLSERLFLPGLSLAVCLMVCAPRAHADLLARIGDIDGFGYVDAPGFHAASGGAANAHGDPVLTAGDFLPDINRDGVVATGSRDDFDLRSASEAGNTGNSFGAGVSNSAGTVGSNYTDISLSTSYDISSAAHRVLVGGNPNIGLVFGSGGAFPSPPAPDLPNQPGFVFSFDVAKANLSSGTPIYFNMVFGDYDVLPAVITITHKDGTTQNITVHTQANAQDGLIQAATATLTFGDVIYGDGGSLWNGYLKVDFVAPNEPYTAFDYVELSTIPLVVGVPEPSTLLVGSAGLISLGLFHRIRRRGA